MKTWEINIRDPFVLYHEGRYYMTGTRGATVWADRATGFDGYVSRDLENWEGPYALFERPEGFTEDKLYWAPEIHEYNGAFYCFVTLDRSDGSGRKGTWALKAEEPLGPYRLHSRGKLTPEDWQCLDGTLYVEDGRPWLVFCREWKDLADGEICAVELSEDLSRSVGKPKSLFAASRGKPMVQPLHHREMPGREIYVTDGPFLWHTRAGELVMLWASFGVGGYLQALARSDNGMLDGVWAVDQTPLFSRDGGHGMLLRTPQGRILLALHQPNEHLQERPCFLDVTQQF